ncbi:squalene/phytoene synthase family protein [candidate division KSB1 bacterium]|nr:squalene/phytoene synthase family protein [candidate division KSB1 bacterium]
MTSHEYCQQTLKKVSRTFAINIAFLQGDLYKSILCAYLFCRIADTVEDSSFAAPEQQKALLTDFRGIFQDKDFSPATMRAWVDAFQHAVSENDPDNEDIKLVTNSEVVLDNFLTLPLPYRNAICDCIVEMSEGMMTTLQMKSRQRNGIYFSKTIAELNRYCYYVAGTVGILLTRLFAYHSKSITRGIAHFLDKHAVSFGLGLQMTNIIKDCWTDYRRGWCYIPEELAISNGLVMENFFKPAYRDQAAVTLNSLIHRAAAHLDDALNYTLHIPRRNYRIRLFCSLPLLFAISTLVAAQNDLRVLAGEKVKISREQVKKIIRDTRLLCFSNTALSNYYHSFRAQLDDSHYSRPT